MVESVYTADLKSAAFTGLRVRVSPEAYKRGYMVKLIAQDDDREELIANHCGLIRPPQRQGTNVVDARDALGNAIEIKSGTTKTAINILNLNLNIIKKYRTYYWLMGQGDYTLGPYNNKVYVLTELWAAHPSNLEWFFSKHENWLTDRLSLLDELNAAANLHPHKQKLLDSIKTSMVSKGPSMNMNKIRNSGYQLDHTNSSVATEQLTEFIKNNPIGISVNNTKTHNWW